AGLARRALGEGARGAALAAPDRQEAGRAEAGAAGGGRRAPAPSGGRGAGAVRALLFERSLPKYGAALVAGHVRAGSGARIGPLRLTEVDEPRLPGPSWHRVRPRLAGICGSDLATVDGKS